MHHHRSQLLLHLTNTAFHRPVVAAATKKSINTIRCCFSSTTTDRKSNFNLSWVKQLRENVDEAVTNARARNVQCDPKFVLNCYEVHAALTQEMQSIRAERNTITSQMKQATEAERNTLRARGQALKKSLADTESRRNTVFAQMEVEALKLPNTTHHKSPIGNADASKVLSMHGTFPEFNFDISDHVQIAENLKLIDFESARSSSGSRFATLTNDAAFLELALTQYALQKLSSQGFTVTLPPDIVQWNLVEACGFAPRFSAAESQVYSLANSADQCLAGTSEISCAGMYANRTVRTSELPQYVAASSHCFRTETSHGGSKFRGLYRLHQFSKVEMFTVSTKSQEEEVMTKMLDLQIEMYEELGLHFRVMDMASEELGAPAHRKIDVEAWMPGRKDFGEIASLSNCTDYQSKRLNIRHQERRKERIENVSTLNGTAIAIPRMIIALLETHQKEDGSVSIPPVLQPFMMNKKYIK